MEAELMGPIEAARITIRQEGELVQVDHRIDHRCRIDSVTQYHGGVGRLGPEVGIPRFQLQHLDRGGTAVGLYAVGIDLEGHQVGQGAEPLIVGLHHKHHFQVSRDIEKVVRPFAVIDVG